MPCRSRLQKPRPLRQDTDRHRVAYQHARNHKRAGKDDFKEAGSLFIALRKSPIDSRLHS